jgi:hypothetical protein
MYVEGNFDRGGNYWVPILLKGGSILVKPSSLGREMGTISIPFSMNEFMYNERIFHVGNKVIWPNHPVWVGNGK